MKQVQSIPTEQELEVQFAFIEDEVMEACKKFPWWPTDILHSDQVINEEKGEATRAALKFFYEKGNIQDYKDELVQTAAMCLRQLVYLEQYQPTQDKEQANA